jgi:hypothetical protein
LGCGIPTHRLSAFATLIDKFVLLVCSYKVTKLN